jgi:hypothetical protein
MCLCAWESELGMGREGGREAVLPLVPTHGSRMRVRDKPRR